MELNYKINGSVSDGRTVVFLHGFLESMQMWSSLDLDQCSFKAVLIDLPGHGHSPLLQDLPPSIEDMSRSVKETLESLNISECDIVGHSMGGYVALEMKRKYPEEIKRVVLLNSNFWSDSDQKRMDRRRVAEIVYSSKSLFLKEAIPNLFLNPEFNKKEVESLIAEASEMSADAIAYSSLAMSERRDQSELVKNFSSDIWIIQGAEDKVVPLIQMESLLPNGLERYYALQHTGHMAHIESSEQVNDILKQIFCK